METTESTVPTFHLGICMAGAVSAGAYTAGVIDYLLEALAAYEKQRGQAGIPCHKVEIPAIGGASAGGMTAIITAAALQQGITHIDKPGNDLLAERPENILYHSWVDLVAVDMFGKMLDTDDIKTEGVVSALNCEFIDTVAQRAITPANASQINWQPLPGFFPDRLKLFTTLSNLEGFTYNVNFVSAGVDNRHPYYMKFHNDYACFEMLRDGQAPANGWMPLDIRTGDYAATAIQAAMATGAFPVGLKARQVTRTKEAVMNNPLVDSRILKAIMPPTDPCYNSLNIDGGMINNEPFDKVRYLLEEPSQQYDQKLYEDYRTFNSTVLMVAPFPSTKPKGIDLSNKLLNVIGLTLSAMISQMRSKPWQVKEANDSNCAGQYLIDPSRHFIAPDGKVVKFAGDKAIACGALSGFSGFLSKEFRVHDFFLGRHNCKIFLKEYFTIPDEHKETNPVFAKGYAGITDERFRAKDGGWQIIPIVEDVNYDFPKLPFTSGKDWPVQEWSAINKFDHPLRKRIEAVIMNITPYNFLQRFALWIGVRVILRGMLAKSILKTIKKELIEWHLVKKDIS
jgi:hypothetical protein